MKIKINQIFLPCHTTHQNLLGRLLGSAPHISRLSAMLDGGVVVEAGIGDPHFLAVSLASGRGTTAHASRWAP